MTEITHYNQWKGGQVSWSPMHLPDYLYTRTGIFPMRAILDSKAGSEVLLCIKDEGENLRDLIQIDPFQLFLKSGIVNTDFGVVFFLLFYIPNPQTKEPLITYEVTLDPHNPDLMMPFQDLARQSHWHVFLLDSNGEERKWFEFQNNFNLGKAIENANRAAQNRPVKDFMKAKRQYEEWFTVEDLLQVE